MARRDDVARGLLELEAVLDGQRAPFSAAAAGPIEARRLEDAAAELSWPLPEELVAWWSWHDGMRSDAAGPALTFGPYGWEVISLEAAVEDLRTWRSASYFPPGAEGPEWLESWLPFAVSGDERLVAKLELSSLDHLVIGHFDLMDRDEPLVKTLDRGLAEIVAVWAQALRDHVVWWDDADHGWRAGPEAWRSSGLT